MSEPVPSHIATRRCQQARSAEWAGELPAQFRSEGFFEDLCSEPPPILRLRRRSDAAAQAWAGVLASALGLRRG